MKIQILDGQKRGGPLWAAHIKKINNNNNNNWSFKTVVNEHLRMFVQDPFRQESYGSSNSLKLCQSKIE